MKAKISLRIAALFMVLHTLGHTFGALTWKDAPNPAIKETIASMVNNRFDFMGRSVTLASFHEGYGLSMIFVLLLVSVLLWLLSNHTENRVSKGILLPIIIFLFILALMEYIYFFPFASAFTIFAALTSLYAFIKVKNTE